MRYELSNFVLCTVCVDVNLGRNVKKLPVFTKDCSQL